MAIKKRILVIDDEKMFTMLVKRMLEDAGYEVKALYSGEATVDQLWEMRFNLLLMDINIARMDGRAIAKQVRYIFKKTPIILMSGKVREDEIEEGLADRYLAKPFAMDSLVATVKELIGDPEESAA